MLTIHDTADLRAWVAEQHRAGRRIGLVPTMGYLHAGHLALVEASRRRADVTVLSSFVNPLQFGPTEDLARYPRDDARDMAMAREAGVAVFYQPTTAAMYPQGGAVRVTPGPAGDRYEGAARPGHFEGVLTVVAILFHQVEPDVACFGQKDIQQAGLVRRMVQDLHWRVELVVVPTVREPDGLALSSRNVYLSAEDRGAALGLSAALGEAHGAWVAGERSARRIEGRMQDCLRGFRGLQIEYIALLDPERFVPQDPVDAGSVVAVAGRVGSTRLIDNIILNQGVR